MKRMDELLESTLQQIAGTKTGLTPEQKKRNQQWLVKIRKQIDTARIASNGKP